MSEGRGYCAGVSAMRDYLVQQFAKYGSQGMFTGMEIANIIFGCKGPE